MRVAWGLSENDVLYNHGFVCSASYEATMDGVQQGLRKFEALNFRWRRPDGTRPDEAPFLAEMVKSDAHMAKVCGSWWIFVSAVWGCDPHHSPNMF
jgi:hypothetical protein